MRGGQKPYLLYYIVIKQMSNKSVARCKKHFLNKKVFLKQ